MRSSVFTADGASPEELVKRAAHSAEDADRQIAVLDAAGRVAVDTAPGCFPVSGHLLGEGWSVQVRGAAELLPPDAVRMLDSAQTPQPWVPGDRSLLIRVPLSTVTGRRVHGRG